MTADNPITSEEIRACVQMHFGGGERHAVLFEFFDRWFLVAPAHVVKDQAEIPAPWGWFQPSNGRLVQARDAEKNKEPRPVDRHFLAAIMRRTAKTDDAFVNAAVERALKDQRADHELELERHVLRRLGDSRRDMESWIKLRDMLKQKPDGWVYQEDVIAALKMLMKSGVGSTISSLRSLKREVDRVQRDLEKIAGELGVEPPS